VDGTVRRFDIRMGRVYSDDVGPAVTGVAVTRDGAAVLAACLDSRLRLLDAREGALLGCYGERPLGVVRPAGWAGRGCWAALVRAAVAGGSG
jgi:hypothetical protein